MLASFFQRLVKHRWLRWLGLAPLLIIAIIAALDDEVLPGVGKLITFASIFGGLFLGSKIGTLVATRLLSAPEDSTNRISRAGAAFGFLFLPVLVAMFSNTYLGTDIALQSVSFHLLFATGAAVFFFYSVRPNR